MRAAAFVILAWLTASSPALAWNYTGHKIVASIAYRSLTAEDQAAFYAILKRHPRYRDDYSEQMPPDVQNGDSATQNEWLAQQASVWPDLVRSGPPDRRAYHRGEWHYINLPIFLNDASRSSLASSLTANIAFQPPIEASLEMPNLNVVQVITFATKQIANPQTGPQERALCLSWLCHTVGDIHQPLHSSAFYSTKQFPEGDRGGNAIRTLQVGNLHALWDQFPGTDDAYRSVRNRAISLLADKEKVPLGEAAAAIVDPQSWAQESHDFARAVVYDEEILSAIRLQETEHQPPAAIRLSNRYLRAGGALADEQILRAGYRLAATLKRLLRP